MTTRSAAPLAGEFFRDIEQFVFTTFAGDRVEWSKGWEYTGDAAWSAPGVLHEILLASFPGWEQAVATLDRHDPHHVFSTTFPERSLVDLRWPRRGRPHERRGVLPAPH